MFYLVFTKLGPIVQTNDDVSQRDIKISNVIYVKKCEELLQCNPYTLKKVKPLLTLTSQSLKHF